MGTGLSGVDPTAAPRTRVSGGANQSPSQRGVRTGAPREPQPLAPEDGESPRVSTQALAGRVGPACLSVEPNSRKSGFVLCLFLVF